MNYALSKARRFQNSFSNLIRRGNPTHAEGIKVYISLTEETKVVIARGFHLFPFRTEKLNPVTPMVVRKCESR